MYDLFSYLSGNPYPGRGILLGCSADGRRAVIAYFIMGRSENSRNRVFEITEDGIRTKAFDESRMTDPSLIIYHPVRVVDGTTIVTNGDQTDTVADAFRSGGSWVRALRTREFEPDGPNHTPRISGMVRPRRLLSPGHSEICGWRPACCRAFSYEYDAPIAGQGHFISTYQTDGDPLPSFEGEPRTVELGDETAAALADRLWNSLNADNKVSLFVRTIDLTTGQTDTAIKNKHQGE